jgi:tetratricopeptide (TPR) repeat protein
VPLALLILWLVFVRLQSQGDKIFAITIMIAVISGRVLIRVLDPINGVVLDFPRLTAYLAPIGIAIAFCLHRVLQMKKITPRFYLMCAALTVVMPFSVIPTFTKINWTDPFAAGLAEQNDFYYRTTGLSFRDAYFYRKQLDRANAWEWSLPVKSPDFLNMRGCNDLAATNQIQDALVSLYRLVGRQPYWAEPRALLAAVLLNQGRLADAKIQIDSCFMLDPDVKSHQVNRYTYLRLTGRIDSAFLLAESAGKQFPSDNDIASDLLVYSFQLKKTERLDSLIRVVLGRQPNAPSAHLVLARLADQKGLTDSARNEYNKFVQYAPANDPDIEPAVSRIEILRKLQKN